MSLYKDASLVMIPTAYKDGKLYSIRPTDGSGDFTFSRGSNLAATRVDVNGLIEKGRENHLLQSNQFDTTWSLTTAISVTSGQADKDGGTNAWLLKRADGSARFIKQTISQSGVQSFSVYIKAESTEWVYLFLGGTTSWAYFDLGSGSVGLTNSLIDSSIEAAGNGFYRCTITASASTSEVRIYPAQGNGAVSGDSDNGVYIQDAQLEAGLVATDYIETGASTAQAGILEDMPRLDYSGGASCPALLLEPQRRNVLAHSEYLNGWNTISAITIEANTDETLSPEGKYNAYKTTAIGGGTQRIYDVISVAAGSITMSMYVKAGTEDQIRLLTTAVTFDITYDLTNATKTEAVGTGTIEPVGNGWYRISATGTSAGGTEVPQVRHLGNAGSSEYQYWYGIQIEEGSYPTSYIPTYGSSVTRSEDSASDTDISSYYVQNGSTLFFEIECDGEVDESNVTAILRLGTSVNTTRVSFLQGYNRIYSTWYDGNTGALGTINNLDAGSRVKVAVQIANDGIARMNGGVNGIGNTIRDYTLSSENYTRLEIYRSSRFKQLAIFPTLLTASEMEALTTL